MVHNVSTYALLERTKQFIRGSLLYRDIPNLITSRLFSRALNRMGIFGSYRRLPQKSLITKRDWDVLIILDACRLDAYLKAKNRPRNGKIYSVYTGASITPHWLTRTWLDGDWSDTIYISANIFANKSIGRMAHLHRLFQYSLKDVFMDIVEVWRWIDGSTGIVSPEKVYRAYKTVKTRMRLKGYILGRDYRMVIHFMQPHLPYITMKKLASLINSLDRTLRESGISLGYDYLFIPLLRKYSSREREILWRHYMNNLEEVLKYVNKIVEGEGGIRKVVTADHGEMLGEMNLYFHFDIDHPILRVVPYHILD